MLTDGQWAVREPLIETCRPPAKVAPQTLRQTMGAILWVLSGPAPLAELAAVRWLA